MAGAVWRWEFWCNFFWCIFVLFHNFRKSVTSFFVAYDALCEEGTATPVCKALDEVADISVPGRIYLLPIVIFMLSIIVYRYPWWFLLLLFPNGASTVMATCSVWHTLSISIHCQIIIGPISVFTTCIL